METSYPNMRSDISAQNKSNNEDKNNSGKVTECLEDEDVRHLNSKCHAFIKKQKMDNSSLGLNLKVRKK